MDRLTKWGVALAAIAVLAGCGREGARGPEAEAPAVQIYEVPPAQLQSVQSALLDVLSANKTGSVSASDGRLVVLAPASTQASIGKAIASLSRDAENEAPAGDAPIRLRFWLLEGGTEAAPPDPRLAMLKPALDEATEGLGLQGYTLQGFADVLASPGKNFISRTSHVIIDGYASRSAAGITLGASLDMVQSNASWAGQVQTNVLLEPGQFLVLSTSAAPDGSMKLVVAQAQLPADEA